MAFFESLKSIKLIFASLLLLFKNISLKYNLKDAYCWFQKISFYRRNFIQKSCNISIRLQALHNWFLPSSEVSFFAGATSKFVIPYVVLNNLLFEFSSVVDVVKMVLEKSYLVKGISCEVKLLTIIFKDKVNFTLVKELVRDYSMFKKYWLCLILNKFLIDEDSKQMDWISFLLINLLTKIALCMYLMQLQTISH